MQYNNQQWLQYYTLVALNERWTLTADAGLRRIDHFSEWAQTLVRAGINYRVAAQAHTGIGWALFYFYQNNQHTRSEIRPYHELGTKQEWGNSTLQHRLRTEFRFFRHTNLGNNNFGNSFNVRFRYRLYFTTPLMKVSNRYPGRQLLLNVGDELFINAGKQIVYNAFENNRLLLGATLQWNENLGITCNYNFQYGQRALPGSFEHSNIVWLSMLQHFKRHDVKH